MKKLVAMVLTFLLILTGCSTVRVTKIDDDIKTDNLKFRKEYTAVGDNNLYEYTTYDNVVDLINDGTGIVYFGYPECNLCKDVVPILNNVAEEKEVKVIMYYNFKDIRDNNTDEYKRLLSILSEYTNEDFKEIKAPTIMFIGKDGIKGMYVGSEAERISEEDETIIKNNFISLIDKMSEDVTEDLTNNEVIDN